MKHLLIISLSLLIVSCGDQETDSNETQTNGNQKVENLTDDQKIKRHIQSELDLTAADKYDINKFSEDLNGDDVKDLIITVNLMERAINNGISSGKTEKMKEMGYMGYYNYIFFMDGLSKEISAGEVVASSPMYLLDINFVNVLGDSKLDFTVDYRVKNMQRRKFFTILDGRPKEVCQAIIFEGLGTPKTDAYHIEYEQGTYNEYHDIVEYKAILEDINIVNLDSSYYYEPTITPTNKEVRRWHFSPSQNKYFMIKD